MCIVELPAGRISSFGICTVVLGFAAVAVAGPAPASDGPVFPRPILVPVPTQVTGIAPAVISLDGTWKINHEPPAEFWRNEVDPASWPDATVPASVQRPDRSTPPARPYAYKREFAVPARFAGQRVILRFDGVSNGARVWINGRFVREHWGTFMAWTCDITNEVTPGADAWLAVEVDDRPVGLAKFVRHGGILRDVRLYAVPRDYLTRFQVETEFDPHYRDATLQVRLAMSFNGGDHGRVHLTLKDASGAIVPLAPDTVELSAAAGETVTRIPVAGPRKWDAEHPNLYTLEATVLGPKGEAWETLARPVGFRELRVAANRLLVNGGEVKLRGIWGNSDVAELRSLNINHTRQKYVTESFLDDADRLGLYVLDELPVDFAKYGPESDPQFTWQWLSLIADLMERDRSHPSVIIWGLGNESFHGANVLQAFHFARAEDPQRPVTFSWANRVPPDQELPYTIYSMHYPDNNDPELNLGDYNVAPWHSTSRLRERQPRPVMPVLHDEYAHVILNEEVILRDPNVRNFWGENIYRYWEKMVATPGALGGDQFGLGLWLGRGIAPDIPEFFLIRKAYSPVRIATRPLANPGDGQPLEIPIKNWHDHTNLEELTVAWSAGGDHGTMAGPDVAPHAAGVLRLPARAWHDGDPVNLKFVEANGRVVDSFELAVNPSPPTLPRPAGLAPALEQNEREIVISGPDFRVVFDKYRGLIKEGSYRGQKVIIDGPFLELLGSGIAYSEWWCDGLRAYREGDEAVVDFNGNYAAFVAHFQVRVDGTGLIATKYTIDHVPAPPPPPAFTPWYATSVGGYSEVGVSYVLRADIDRLAWRRQTLWSAYPPDHIGRPVGIAQRAPDPATGAPFARREDPTGAGANDWRSLKENILTASAWVEGSGAAVTALADGHAAVRLEIYHGFQALQPGVRMHLDNDWNYPDFGLANYTRPPIVVGPGYSNVVFLRLGPATAAP